MMRQNQWILRILCLFVCTIECHASVANKWPLDLVSNGYEELLIAIHPDVAENQTLIDDIKSTFTDASASLFRATNNRAFFRNITILVPEKWSNKPEYVPVTGETFDLAHVRIAGPNALYGDAPYVKQLTGCGEGGEFMHLTPNFLQNKATSQQQWGPYGKVIVHEWGHLRWGLFDEYPKTSEGDKAFYSTGEGFRPSRCTEGIQGTSKNRNTGGICQINFFTFLPEDDCRFYPTTTGNTAKASLMYGQYIDSVEEFCSSTSLGVKHNARASNKQNRLCSSKSSWDVMLEHIDFKDENNPSIVDYSEYEEGESEPTDTTPTFKIVQSVNRRVILLLDVSGSMSGGRLEKMRQGAFNYLNTLPDGTSIGMAKFSSSATKLSSMREITNQTVRDELTALVPDAVGGWTCIGCALQMGYDILTENGGNPSGAEMLLLSDGEENRSPVIADLQPILVTNGVKVDVIAYSAAADIDMSALATATGGASYFYSGAASSTALNDAMSSAAQDTTQTDRVVVITSAAITIGAMETYNGTFTLDSSIGKDTSISLSYDTIVSLVVYSPDGQNFTLGSAEFQDYPAFKVIRVIVAQAGPGQWRYDITAGNAISNIQLNIHSSASSDLGAISATPMISSSTATFSDNMTFSIYAEVTQGGFPVVNANVKGLIECPINDVVVELKLKDNGAGADITMNDGVYSAFFMATDANSNGRYSIKVQVTNKEGTQVQVSGMAEGAASVGVEANMDATYSNVSDLSRTASAGALTLDGFPYVGYVASDVIAPSRITDLAVVEVSDVASRATLQWTAVGDDLDQGTATRYEIRAAESFDDLFNMVNYTTVPDMLVVSGNLTTPKASGETEVVTVLFPSISAATFSFGVVAIDERNNTGDMSNIVTASSVYSTDDLGLGGSGTASVTFTPSLVIMAVSVWLVI